MRAVELVADCAASSTADCHNEPSSFDRHDLRAAKLLQLPLKLRDLFADPGVPAVYDQPPSFD